MRERLDNAMSAEIQQPDMRLRLAHEGNAHAADAALRKAMTSAIAQCQQSRAQIANAMSQSLNRPFSAAMLDAFVAVTHANRFPAAWLPAFCAVTGSVTPLRLLASRSGMCLVSPEEAALIEALVALARIPKVRTER